VDRFRSPGLGRGGFALTELLVTMVALAVVAGGLMTMLTTSQRHYMTGAGQIEAQQNVRVALDRMLRDIREAGYNPTLAPAFPAIVSVAGGNALPTATAFMIQNDWNGNGVPDNAAVCLPGGAPPAGAPPTCPPGTTLRGEQIRYAINGARLTRQESGVDAVPQAIVGGLTLAGIPQPFQYLNQGVMPPAPPAVGSDITTVILTLQAVSETSASGTPGHVVVRMNDSIRLRNK